MRFLSFRLSRIAAMEMHDFSHLRGLSVRQIRDGLRKAGYPEGHIRLYEPTEAGMNRLLDLVQGLIGWDGKHRRPPPRVPFTEEELLERARLEVERWNADRNASEQPQTPKSLKSIMRAAQKERWPREQEVRRKQLDVFFCGLPKRVAKIDLTDCPRGASYSMVENSKLTDFPLFSVSIKDMIVNKTYFVRRLPAAVYGMMKADSH